MVLRPFGERCQVDDLKKALCLELELGFSSGVVCRRAMTKIVVMSVAHEIRQSKRKRNCPSQQARLTYTASRRAFQVKPALPPSLPVPHLSLAACRTGSGWRKKRCQLVCATQLSPALGFDDFSAQGLCRRPARREDCYWFVLPQKTDDV